MFYIFIYIFNFVLSGTNVFIHIERMNKYIIHTGISFDDGEKNIRYDFRGFNDDNNYITTDKNRNDLNTMFPLIDFNEKITDWYNEYRSNIDLFSKDIFWGITNYTIDEIIEYEKTISIKKYIVGINDCRHYVDKLSRFCLNKGLPIWKLNELMDS